MSIRIPAVAGTFYPADPKEILSMLRRWNPTLEDQRARAIVVPHAGYIYSGETAAKVYAKVRVPERVLLLGPNHTGLGARVAVYPEGRWRVPLGEMAVDEELTRALLEGLPEATPDTLAHREEHALEVQVNFLLWRNPHARGAFVVLKVLSWAQIQEMARHMVQLLQPFPDLLLVVSTDLSHYYPESVAQKLDAILIDALRRVDPEALWRATMEEGINMCGFIPATLLLAYLREQGYEGKGELVEYTTSARTSGDCGSVVGYAGVIYP